MCNPPLAESALARTNQRGVGHPIAEEIAAVALFNDDWLESALSHAVLSGNGLAPQHQTLLDSIRFKCK